VIFETRLAGGDADAAFQSPFGCIAGPSPAGGTGVTIEAPGLLADFEPFTRSLTVWISTQVPT
jgi:hypothetical protein